ncbi:TetR/AcrR family transcriptional regulator [Arthrobacter sp. B3I4]|uniref:TetR/AcrR family transcriptional regulator n=1 Tax=Arthrobacter sp. B3I4 TaxID=3042267 RepID=UPI00278B0E14|nr:TetR family transcriptional regulator [Arthrobacter sp. B3I4]MDQ0756589.1 AcrR family transcriptional regulator [Arthrobacter sp. B3I4]
MTSQPTGLSADGPVATAVGLLARQGFDATSVEELAEAAGMSRSTFFRKFGSKEDVVFADHERILAQVNDQLAASRQDPLAAVEDAALLVFDHHLRNRDTSRARYELMQAVPALRDRELVTSHRYERAFLLHLLDRLPDGGHREHQAVAFAAAVVAVHNAFLRQWLRAAPGVTQPAEAADGADRVKSSALANELQALSALFRPALLGGARFAGAGHAELGGAGTEAASTAARPTVVVTVLTAGADKDAIAQAVRDALP